MEEASNWCKDNFVKGNYDKYQTITFGPSAEVTNENTEHLFNNKQ